jgi:hypothetical protein
MVCIRYWQKNPKHIFDNSGGYYYWNCKSNNQKNVITKDSTAVRLHNNT